ncbi:MAG TPA: CPBP family intramembrane glutamic endopeptidase [Ktedonobacteraceae bacterium]
MSTIVTTSQPATSSPLRRLIVDHPLVAYFVIAFAGTWAFLLPFALSRNVNGLGLLPFTLPDSAFLIAFVLGTLAGPALASLSVTAVTSGRAGVGQLLRRCVQWRVGIGWYLIAIFGFPLIYLVAYSVFLGMNLPLALLVQWPLLFTVFLPWAVFNILTGSFAEELGWRGFALPRLQQRYGPVLGSIILGTLHGLWHLPAFFTRLLGPFSLPYYAGFLFAAIASTFLCTWIFNHTKGSVLLATLTHACSNGAQNVLALLIPAQLVVSGWAAPIANGNWNGVNVISIGALVALLLIFTRGRLGFNPKRNAQLIEVPRPTEAPLAKV